MLLLRVQLPDRPGSLGQVATAIGLVGADIASMEIVHKQPDGGLVIDDFMIELPAGVLAESVVVACTELDGVQVLWLSRYPDQWGTLSDLDVLNRMTAAGSQARQVLTQDAPTLFRCQWAALVDLDAGRTLLGSGHAPQLGPEQLGGLRGLQRAEGFGTEESWLPGWGEYELAVVPLSDAQALLLGRRGGPEFLDSELDRLNRLADFATR